MRVDKELFLKWVEVLAQGRGGSFGPCLEGSVVWCVQNSLPRKLVELFESRIPKKEIAAGAGALFAEGDMIKWNNWFPEALQARLLIVGSAPNGDHIAIDLSHGSTGYISHEHDWRQHPRRYFIPVSPSIGSYIREINSDPPQVPDDYWDAKSRLPKADSQ